jgi:predicted ester cyclase
MMWGRDIAEVLADPGPRRQPLAGFDSDYHDIVHYILTCTHRIWEQKDIGLIASHYADDCPVWTGAGPAAGVAGVVAGTLRTLAAFPDRTLIGEAVIWRGDEAAGYLSSHRIISTATHHGAGEFGPATGRRAAFLTIADCLCRANRIVEEWLVRDNSHIALQLGLSPRALAAATPPPAAARDWWAAEQARVAAARPLPAALAMPDPQHQPDDFVHWFAATIIGQRRLALARDAYAPAATLAAPGGRRLIGHGEIIGWWVALLSCLGDARLVVDHVAAQPVSDDPADGTDIAWRWTLAGQHDGLALYGPASGRPVVVLGISHWRIAGGRIAAEWTVFDEIALLRQVIAA